MHYNIQFSDILSVLAFKIVNVQTETSNGHFLLLSLYRYVCLF